uniref:DNA helicase n=1 Tax=Ignisphaera aggregans TaxID=334771 RepID=A0A7C4H780_9CREN
MEELDKTISSHIIDYLSMIEEFIKYYKDSDGKAKYVNSLKRVLVENKSSIELSFTDILSFSTELADYISRNPEQALNKFSETFRKIIELEIPEYLDKIPHIVPRVVDIPSSLIVKIRDLRSIHIGKLIAIEGIVVRATPPIQKIVKAVFRHECGNEVVEQVVGEIIEKPIQCPYCRKTGGSWRLIVEKSQYRDFQRLVIQERPEEMPAGRMPRSIEVDVYDDLVDVARPGDRVTVVGIPKIRTPESKKTRSIYTMFIDANNIIVSQRMLEEIEITKEDEERILYLARDPLIRRKIIASIAPAIYGMWDIKEAIALMLFGGNLKQLKDGTRIRGDIHVLIIGDPGTAKSQLLQYVARIAPRAIYTTGKGATAAGLTAAVIRDKQTGEFYLEAGALVLADGGVACIDEIDKMREEDRVAIHEAMEQQTISIAKAGIVARLNSRTSVLAAGNPRYGRYLPNRSISDNVNLPPTILSRFDLIFVIKDIPTTNRDLKLARHITITHSEYEEIKPLIDIELLRKYIAYARKYVRPELSEEARRIIENFFVEMRKKSLEVPESPIAITARQLEALIRLAEAHAKMALKHEVTEEDAAEAIRLMKSMLESVGIDVERGEVDIDVIMTGQPKSQRERMLIIEEIIRDLSKSEGCAKMRDIVVKARERNIDERLVEETLSRMRREGIIYKAREECYALTL